MSAQERPLWELPLKRDLNEEVKSHVCLSLLFITMIKTLTKNNLGNETFICLMGTIHYQGSQGGNLEPMEQNTSGGVLSVVCKCSPEDSANSKNLKGLE